MKIKNNAIEPIHPSSKILVSNMLSLDFDAFLSAECDARLKSSSQKETSTKNDQKDDHESESKQSTPHSSPSENKTKTSPSSLPSSVKKEKGSTSLIPEIPIGLIQMDRTMQIIQIILNQIKQIEMDPKKEFEPNRYYFKTATAEIPLEVSVKRVEDQLAITLFSTGELKELLNTHMTELCAYLKLKGINIASLTIAEQAKSSDSDQENKQKKRIMVYNHDEKESSENFEDFIK